MSSMQKHTMAQAGRTAPPSPPFTLTTPQLRRFLAQPSQQAAGSYKVGAKIGAEITFSEKVTVTAASDSDKPKLTFKLDSSEKDAIYLSGSGTTKLLFEYTVAAGDSDTDGIAIESDKLALQGNGTIQDLADNAAIRGHNAATGLTVIKIDTAAPNVTITTAPAINGTNHTAWDIAGGCTSGDGDMTVTLGSTNYNSTVRCNGSWSISDWDVQSITGTDGTLTLTVSQTDTASNVGTATQSITIDKAAPTTPAITTSQSAATLKIGDTIVFTVTYNEDVVVTGNPTLNVTVGSSTKTAACVIDGSDAKIVNCTYTVAENDADSDGIEIPASALSANDSTNSIKDAVGNEAAINNTTWAKPVAINVDGVRPTATFGAAPATNGSGNFDIEITLSEAPASSTSFTVADDITVTGDTGTPSMTNSNLVYTLTVTPGSGQSQAVITVKEGAFKDAAGNDNATVSKTITYDKTAPSKPSGLTVSDSHDNDSTPDITVNGVVAGDTVTLYTDSSCTSGNAKGNGVVQASQTSITITTNTLTEGPHTFYAKAVDPAQNASDCSTNSVTYTYDNTVPALENSGSTTTFRQADVSVTLKFDEKVTIDNTEAGAITVSEATEGNLTGTGPTDTYTLDLTGATVGTAITITIDKDKVTDQAGLKPTSDITLTINSQPAPVAAAPNVTAANQALKITWSAPNTGGSEITGYQIDYKVDHASAPKYSVKAGNITSHTLLGLINGLNYKVTVAAINSQGTGVASAESAATAPTNSGAPSVVTNFLVKPGNGKLTVSWGAPEESGNAAITGYDLAHDCVSGDNWTDVPVTSADMSGEDITLSNDIACLLRIRAKNGSDGPYVYASATPKSDAATTGAPDEPRNVRAYERASGSTDYDVIMWEAPYNNGGRAIDHYELQYKKNGDTGWHDFDADGTETTCDGNIDDLENSCTARFTSSINNDDGDLSSDRTNRRFQIRACNTANDTSCSGWIETGAPIKSGPLAMGSTAPTVANSTASGGAGKLTVTYDAPDHNGGSAITEYEVQYVSGSTAGSPPSFGWAAVPSSNTGTCDDSGLTAINCTHIDKTAAGNYFWYRVRAHNAVGASPWAYVANAGGKHAYQLPPAPTSVAVAESDTAGQVKVTWILSDTSDAWVAALNDQEVDYLRTADPNSTPSPDNSSWASYSNDTGTSDDCSDTDVDQSTNSSSNPCGMKKASLSGSTGDYLWVRVRSTSVSSATTGDWSDWNTSAVYYEAPPAPSITSISEASDVLTVNWTKSDTSGDLVPDLTDQEVQYARMASSQSSAPTDNGDWQAYTDAVAGDCTADQVLAGTGSCTMKESELDRKTPGNNAKSDKLWVRVRGENGKEGDWAVSSVQTPFVTTPGVPTGVSASSNGAGTSITLSWTSPGDTNGIITGYDVWWKQAASAPTQDNQWEESPTGCTSLDSSTGCTHTGLTKGQKYWYRVRAKNGVNGIWADSVSETTNSAPSAPSNLTVTKTGYQELSISWSAASASPTDGKKAVGSYVAQAIQKDSAPGVDDSGWSNVTECTLDTRTKVTCIDTGLIASTKYWYRVKANNGIDSTWSTMASGTDTVANKPTLSMQTPNQNTGNNDTPTIRVSNIFPGYKAELYSNSTCSTSISNESNAVGAGASHMDIDTSDLGSDGSNSIYAKAVHDNKQDSVCSDSLTYTLDTVNPSTPTLQLPSGVISPNKDLTPTFSVTTLESGTKLTLHNAASCGGSVIATASVSGSSESITLSGDLADNTAHTITAKSEDAAGNTSCSTSLSYTTDNTAPGSAVVTVTGSNSARTYKTGETIEFVVDFDEAVTVDTSSGTTPTLTFQMGTNTGTDTNATYVGLNSSDSSKMKFNYTVADTDSDTDGIEIADNKLSANSDTIQDAAGNNATLTHSAVSNLTNVKIDGTVPSVPRNFSAVATSTPNESALSWVAPATNGNTAVTHYQVQYDENPSKPADGDFAATGSGDCNGNIDDAKTSCNHTVSATKDKWYRIRACNGSTDTNCGIWTKGLKVGQISAPATFTLTAQTSPAIKLDWTAPSHLNSLTIGSYKVQYRTSTNSLASDDAGDGTWADADNGCDPSNDTNDTDLTCTHSLATAPADNYKHFRVRACDNSGTPVCGAWAYASDLSLVVPTWAATNPQQWSGSAATLDWVAETYNNMGTAFDADSYEVQFANVASGNPPTEDAGWTNAGDTDGGTGCTSIDGSTTTCVHTLPHESGKPSRFFRIRACDADGAGMGGGKACGSWLVSASALTTS